MNVILLLSWIYISLVFGVWEAGHWHMKQNLKIPPDNEHKVWTTLRIVILLPFLFHSLWYLPVCALIFPFLHDGVYYWCRNSLDNSYPKGFRDHSKTSTAYLTKFFPWPVRVVCFVSGIGLWVWKILLN